MQLLMRSFLLIALSASAAALVAPSLFFWIKPLIPLLLALIMFFMGTRVTGEDFRDVWKKRRLVLLAAAVQYTCMPLIALLLASLFSFGPELSAGMVIVGSCPGGTASNVIVYLFRGNVALSVTMTLFSTMLAPLLTPLIMYCCLSASVELSLESLLLSVFQVVALPLLAGIAVRHAFGGAVERVSPLFPGLSVAAITLIIACVMALNAEQVRLFPGQLILAVMLHNLLGLGAGYAFARLAGASVCDSRTIAIETGMQNSGLGVALANGFFPPLAALPAALFSLWHNLSGLAAVGVWRSRSHGCGE